MHESRRFLQSLEIDHHHHGIPLLFARRVKPSFQLALSPAPGVNSRFFPLTWEFFRFVRQNGFLAAKTLMEINAL
jgi:hypothetical protein